jgi:cytochrome c-type biogenesis protein CcmH/NrfG
MLTSQNIKERIATLSVDDQLSAIESLLTSVTTDGERSLLLAEKGKILWRMNRRGEAMSAYEQGAQLDPDGPAALLLAHSQSIMEFFNPDLLNP